MQQNMQKQADAETLIQKSDELFACCIQFLLGKEEFWLTKIHDLSQFLLEHGYETSFQHKRKALIVRSLLAQLSIQAAHDDKLLPKQEELPDVK